MRMLFAWWMLMFFAGVCLFLAGCDTIKQGIVTQFDIPIPVACHVDVGEDPAYADTKEALRAAPGIDSRVNLLLAGRLQRDKRIDDLKASVAGCDTE